MATNPKRERKLRRSACVLLLLGTATPVLALQGPRCPEDPKVVAIEITVDRSARQVGVSPTSVEIHLDGERGPNRVCWNITGLVEGFSLSFVDKQGSTNVFPALGRKVKGPRGFLNSGRASRAGKWVYGVRLVDADGNTVAEIDPEVIVKGSG